MRFDIAKSGSGLVYEIRNIVNVANRLKQVGRRGDLGEHRRSRPEGGEDPRLDAGGPCRSPAGRLLLRLFPDEGDGCDPRIPCGKGQPAGKGADHAGGYHLLQRSRRRDRPRLQRHPRRRADHHAGADLLHAPLGGGPPRLVSPEHLPDEPLLRLVSGHQRTGAEGEEPQGHRRDPRHQSRQPHRLCLSRGDAPADRGNRPELRPLPHLRRDLPATSSSTGRRPSPCPTSSAMCRGSA